MLIHQAVYGPLRGHAFLQGSSVELEEMFRNAAWMTDLPQTAPSGVGWTGFLRLVRLDEQLLLIHTSPCEGSSRAGMVQSRAAFIPLAVVEHLHDLRPVARVLQTQWKTGDATLPIELDASPVFAHANDPAFLTGQIAAALSQRTDRPLVIIGQEGFDEAMMDLWARVPPAFRSHLTFGLSFGQDDVRDLSIVCSPNELLGRWSAAQLVVRTTQDGACSHTATLLNLPIGASARSFANELQLKLNSPTAIKIALKAYQLWNEGTSPADTVNLLRILVERAGSEPSATVIKSAVVEKLASSVADWTAREVLSIRNLELSAISGQENLGKILTSWVSSLPSNAVPHDIEEIMQSWATGKPTPLWLSAVGIGLESVLANEPADNSLLPELWDSMTKIPEQAGRLLPLLSSAKGPQKRLIESMPQSIEPSAADRLLPEFISRCWWEAAGLLLARSRPTSDSLKTAIRLNTKGANKVFLTSALSEASDQEVLEAAVESKNPIAIQIAADVCVRTPKLMHKFNWADKFWFQLLGEAASKSKDIIEALPNVPEGMGKTIEAQLTDESVWGVIACTALADLVDVPQRRQAWSSIPLKYAATIAAATAKSWLLRFEEGKAEPSQLEPELATAVRTVITNSGYLVQVLRRTPSSLPLYLREFGFTSERNARLFLADLKANDVVLSESAAQALGCAFKENLWNQAAQEAALSLHSRSDFRPILKECISLLGIIDQLWVGFQLGIPVHLSQEESWTAFESEATSLYPRGPSERELWSRSGGRNEDLANESDGRSTWHRCIRELRSGKAPGVTALLEGMLEDYPFNDTLKHLSRQTYWRYP